MARTCLTAILVLSGLVVSEAGRKIRKADWWFGNDDAAPLADPAQADAIWESYVADLTYKANEHAGGFQPECEPSKHEATGPYVGVIMLHHGFTACPQQYKRIVPRLQERGFTVYLPTIPGMGYKYKKLENGEKLENGTYEDNIVDLLTDADEYRSFADTMHEVMMNLPGQKVVGGLSVGGGIAAYQGYLGGYDRRLLVVPMILPFEDSVWFRLAQLASVFAPDSVMNERRGWGGACELEERLGGRAGICQFTAKNLVAAVDIGADHNRAAWFKGANFEEGQMQIIFTDGDDAVSSAAVVHLAEHYGMDKSSAWICGMDKVVPHSFLAMEDNQEDNMYWLAEVEDMFVGFLSDGQSFPQHGISGTLDMPRCDIQCTPETCHFGLKYQ